MRITLGKQTLVLQLHEYFNHTLAVTAETADGEPYARLSVNLPESLDLPKNAFYLKHYSENAPVARALLDSGLIEPLNPFLYPKVRTGFVEVAAYQFTEDAIA
jgi:hypothetical protein